MKKLTLSADPEVIEQAKRLADETGTSVSALFERFIRLLAQRYPERRIGRITRQATGMITLPSCKSDHDVLADALIEKYGINNK